MGRNLNNRSFEVLGVDQRIWLSLETGGFGDGATGGLLPQAAGAVEHITADIKFNIPREDSAARSGRSVVTRLSGKKEVEVSYESYIIPGTPSGGNPTLPPMHPFLLCAFGAVDTSDPSKIVYSLSRLNGNSFRMLEELTHYSRLATGCVADTISFSLAGDGKAQFKMSGFAQDVKVGGSATLSADVSASNDLVLQTGEGDLFEVGGSIDVIQAADGDTAIATARKITGIVGDTLTVDGAAITASEDDIVIGHAPATYSPLTSENALLGLKGSVSIAGYTGLGLCEVISADIELKNNFTKRDFAYGKSSICGYLPDKRRNISVKLKVLLTKDNFGLFMRNKKFIQEDLTITLEPQDIPAPSFSSSDARTFKWHFPKVEFNIPPITAPADGYVPLELEGVALASDINNTDDEMTLTIE